MATLFASLSLVLDYQETQESSLLLPRALSPVGALCTASSTCVTNFCQFSQCRIPVKGACLSTNTQSCQILTTCSASGQCTVRNGLPALNSDTTTCDSGYCRTLNFPFNGLCLCSACSANGDCASGLCSKGKCIGELVFV